MPGRGRVADGSLSVALLLPMTLCDAGQAIELYLYNLVHDAATNGHVEGRWHVTL